MGISVGAVFFQTDAIDGIFGVLFQGMLFIMLGAFPAVFKNFVYVSSYIFFSFASSLVYFVSIKDQ